MDISKLKQYRQMKADLEALGIQIEGLYNTYRSPNLCKIGTSGNNYSGSPVSSAVNHITALQEEFTKEYYQMIALGKEIEDWLHSISDAEIVAIIRCHYLCGMPWDETTKKVLGSYYSGAASRVKLKRYLEKEQGAEADNEAL